MHTAREGMVRLCMLSDANRMPLTGSCFQLCEGKTHYQAKIDARTAISIPVMMGVFPYQPQLLPFPLVCVTYPWSLD